MNIPFDNTYARLPERFFARQSPARVPEPKLVRLNHGLAARLSIDSDWLESFDGVAMLAGNAISEGSQPIAQAYAGHQFGGFVPRLGDGRAILLGGSRRHRRPTLRCAVEGFGAHAVFPRRRWQSCARPGGPRIHCQRGHGSAGGAHDPGARRCDHRRNGHAPGRPARRRCVYPALRQVTFASGRFSIFSRATISMLCACSPITSLPGTTRTPPTHRTGTQRCSSRSRLPRRI